MATPDDIADFSLDGTTNFTDLQQFIVDNETLDQDFIFMEATPAPAGTNTLYYEMHDDDTMKDPIMLQAIPPGLDDQTASAFIDQLVDHGLQPFKSYFNVLVSGKLASILPCRQGTPPPLPPDMTGWIPTIATVFGLNMDGSKDAGDNGVGAPILGPGGVGINTRNPDLRGCALPIPVLRKRFGSLLGARGQSIRVRKQGDNGDGINVQIVDLGPSNAQIRKGVALDLTLGAQRAIGGNGFTKVEYHL